MHEGCVFQEFENRYAKLEPKPDAKDEKSEDCCIARSEARDKDNKEIRPKPLVRFQSQAKLTVMQHKTQMNNLMSYITFPSNTFIRLVIILAFLIPFMTV